MRNIFSLLVGLLILSGCCVYGTGREVCYISSVDDGIFWASIFTKTDLSSSDADVYIVRKDDEVLREKLFNFAKSRERVAIKYKKHICTASLGSSDEIVSVICLEEK